MIGAKASGGAAARRGLRFTPGEAQAVLWALALLGTGALVLMKASAGRRSPAELPAITGPADEPAPRAKAPAPVQAAKPEPAVSVDLSEDDVTTYLRSRRKREPVKPRRPKGEQHEVTLE